MKSAVKFAIGGAALAVLGGIGAMQIADATEGSVSAPVNAAGWSDPEYVDNVGFSDRFDGLAVDPPGNGLMVAGPSIWSRTAGGEWSKTAVQLSAPTKNATVAVLANGRAIAAWDTTNGVWYTTRNPDGRWAALKKLAIESRLMDLAIDASGDAIFGSIGSYLDPSGEYRYTAYTQLVNADGTEEPLATIGPLQHIDSFDLSVSPTGNTQVIWIDPSGILHLKSGSLTGGVWRSSTTHLPPQAMQVSSSSPRTAINDAGEFRWASPRGPP